MEKIKLRGEVVGYNKRHNLLKLSLKSVQIENKKAEDISEPLILRCFWDDSLLDSIAPSEIPNGDEAIVTVNINGEFFVVSAIEHIPISKQIKTISLIEYVDGLVHQCGKDSKT